MRHLTSLIALSAFTVFLASCSDTENSWKDLSGTSLTIHADIGSRAVDNTWQAGDAIGVLMLNAGTTTPAGKVLNYKYITSAGDGAFTAIDKENIAWYPQDGAEVDLLAYYPFTAKLEAASLSLPVDVTSQDNLPAIDLMTSTPVTGLSIKKPDAQLTFAHKLSKLILKVKADKALGDVALAGACAVLSGTPATATYSLLEDKLTGEGEVTDINLPLSASGDVATAIVLPTPAGAGKSITVTLANGSIFTAQIPSDLAFQSGTVNTCTMTLYPSEARLTATILPWTDGIEAELETLKLNVPTEEGVPAVTSFTLVRLTDGSSPIEVKYTFVDGDWTADPSPFYVEDILSTDRFGAIHTPAEADADTVTQLLDYMSAGTVAYANDAVSLNFKHLMTQLKFVVKSEGGKILEGAAVTTPALKTEVDVKMTTEEGYFIEPKATSAVYEEMPAGTSYLMVPQEASGTYVVKLKGGQKFSTEVKNFTLEAGKLNTLTFKVSAVNVVIDQVTVNDWELGKEVVIGEGAIYNITENGTLTVFNEGTQKSGTYPVVYANGKASFGTGGTPLEWGDDKGTKVPLKALFEPTAPAVGNQEKDFLYTKTSVAWGVPPSLELAHAMGRIRLSLTSSDGTYKDEDLKGAALTTERAYKSKIVNDCTLEQDNNVAEAEKTVTFTNKKDKTYMATLYPQTISKLQLTIAGKTYTLEKTMALEAGKIYNLKADIGHNITVSDITVVDWKEVDGGNGTFTE